MVDKATAKSWCVRDSKPEDLKVLTICLRASTETSGLFYFEFIDENIKYMFIVWILK